MPPTGFKTCSWSVSENKGEQKRSPRGTLNMGQGKQGQRDFHGKEQMALALAVKTKILNH